jgi:polysaccharide biosynthesis protein PslH
MHALIISTHVPYFPATGASTRDHFLAKHLAKHHRISFLAPIYHQAQAEMAEALPEWLELHTVDIRHRARLKDRRPSTPGRLRESRLHRMRHIALEPPYEIMTLEPTIAALEEALRRVDWSSIDIIQIEHTPIGRLRQAMPDHIPAILDCHNVHSSMREREYEAATRWRRRIAEWAEWQKTRAYERNTMKGFDWLLACSEVDKARLQRLDNSVSCLVVPNGVDVGYFQPSQPSAGATQDLLFVGNMSYEPNIEAVTFFCDRIFPKVQRECPDARLLIVGHRPSSSVKRLADQSPGTIIVIGSVDDVRPYMSSAAVGVVPLLNGGGTRLKILEMLSMEMAVVTTSIGCEGLDVIDGRHLLVGDTAATFSHAVRTLLQSQALRKRLGVQGRKLVQAKYEWCQIAQTVNDLWLSLGAV